VFIQKKTFAHPKKPHAQEAGIAVCSPPSNHVNTDLHKIKNSLFFSGPFLHGDKTGQIDKLVGYMENPKLSFSFLLFTIFNKLFLLVVVAAFCYVAGPFLSSAQSIESP
jgi:hypothetical protein